MLGWKKRLRLDLGEIVDITKLDEWDWSTEEIFRASFAVMSLRTWSEFEEIEVRLSELLKMYFVWYIQDCKGCKTEEDYELYAENEMDFVDLLRDKYYKIQKTFWEEETYLPGQLVFGDPPDGANIGGTDSQLFYSQMKRIIAASNIPLCVIGKYNLTMPYKLVRDV